jgi:Flp pilus assembly pilin Flp
MGYLQQLRPLKNKRGTSSVEYSMMALCVLIVLISTRSMFVQAVSNPFNKLKDNTLEFLTPAGQGGGGG